MFRQTCAVALTVLALVATVAAKGPTVRLTVAGGEIASPLAITDPSLLAESNVYGGTFLGPIADSQSVNPAWPKYVVSFFVELPAWMHQGVQMKYVVHYARNPQTGDGFVYLPAPREDYYGLNVSTIFRNGLEGNWLHASKAWATTLNRHLP